MILEAFTYCINKRNLDDGLNSEHMSLDQNAFVGCSQL